MAPQPLLQPQCTRTTASITAELFGFLFPPMLLIVPNLVHSDRSVWIIGAAIGSPVLITLTASSLLVSHYQVMGQYFYWSMSWSIIVWTNVSHSLINATYTATLPILAILISEAVFFTLLSQGGGDLGTFGVVHGNIWRGIRIVGDAVYEMVNGAIEGIRKTWKGIGVMFRQDSEVQAMEGVHDHVPMDLVHGPYLGKHHHSSSNMKLSEYYV